jgi:hypothetical protein
MWFAIRLTPRVTRWERSTGYISANVGRRRVVVTSLTRAEGKARYLYEKVYCARGDMENRIKECQLALYADCTSTATKTRQL